jgi:hypothetical protein
MPPQSEGKTIQLKKEEAKPTMQEINDQRRVIIRGKSHMPKDSILYERIVPALLLVFGIVMVVLILLAAGVLLGIVPFR